MAYVEVEGLKEFNRAVRQIRSRDLDKRLGQANKRVGQLIVDRLYPSPDPRATGVGRGATPRPSASKREVLLRVGGAHRGRNGATPQQAQMQPWGIKRVARPGTELPDRPYIQKTAEDHVAEIGEAYLTGIVEAFAPAFAEARA